MSKLYVALVGLTASGKCTLAKRIRDDFVDEGINCAIFNNGELRRKIAGPASTESSWYAPDNSEGREIRERIALANMQEAKKFLSEGGDVAVLDATNGSRKRRRLLEETLNDHPLLFIECLNEDPVLHEACIRRKALLPEYASYSEEDAVESFKARIAYYNSIYEHLDEEKYYLCVDTMANRIMAERPMEGSPYYPAIRELIVTTWARELYLVRHGQTEFNAEGRIGGDPLLSEKGRMQAAQLAEHMKDTRIDYIFTSTRRRSGETAAFLAKTRPDVRIYALPEFDELNAGVCENMRYEEIRETMPEVTRGRNADKFNFCYPGGESYAMVMQRVLRGLRRALFLSAGAPTCIVGHQAINRVVLSMFMRQRTEDIPYMFVPQNQYYRIECTPRVRLVKRIPYLAKKV